MSSASAGAAPRRVRVLVVEESPSVRNRVCEVLDVDGQLEVAGAASSAARAVELCEEQRPDVVMADLGFEAARLTEQIMASCPTPIVVASAAARREERFAAFDALAAGAVGLLEKPRAYEFEGVWEWQLRTALQGAARVRATRTARVDDASQEGGPRPRVGSRPEGADGGTEQPVRALAIGASVAGGTAALLQVLQALPLGFEIPVLAILHLPDPFASAFAEWLDDRISRRVALARDREPLASLSGRVTLAVPGRHLSLASGRLRLSDEPERAGFRPSLDGLFESLAQELGTEVAACLLSGAGRDGAEGLLELRKRGGLSLVQDEGSCVAHGMPGEAVRLAAAERELPICELARVLGGLRPPEDR